MKTEHKNGCPALSGYGHGPEPCICGAQPQRSEQRTQCPTCGQTIPLHSELQRSEQQEWTVGRVKNYLKWGDGVEKLAMDFTAELTAERQGREQAEETYRGKYRVHAELIERLTQQLLSALAAIEKADALCMDGHGYEAHTVLSRVDLSLLHEHDKELTEKARKPLMVCAGIRIT